MNPLALAPKLRRRVTEEVTADEPIHWLEQPHPWAYLLESIPLILVAIPWFAVFLLGLLLKIFQEKENFLHNPEDISTFAWIGFIGVCIASAPLFNRWLAQCTVYVITDRRAIIIECRFRLRVFSYPLSELKDIERRPYGDGWGDLILERIVTQNSDGMEDVFERGFIRIPNCRDVLNLLNELKAKDQASPTPS